MVKVARNSREIVRRLAGEGWTLVKLQGNHHKFTHSDHTYPIIVPHPQKDLPTGTARAIARAAEWLDTKKP